MTLEQIQKICSKFPAVTQDIKWENHLCFNVGAKMFLITSPDEVPVKASFKVSDENFHNLTSMTGIIPAPYLARYKWVQVDDINRLSRSEWEKYLSDAYSIISSKLPAKIKKEIRISYAK